VYESVIEGGKYVSNTKNIFSLSNLGSKQIILFHKTHETKKYTSSTYNYLQTLPEVQVRLLALPSELFPFEEPFYKKNITIIGT